jgi:hypothetical protein
MFQGYNLEAIGGIYIIKTITAICITTILVGVAICGCTEKQAAEDLTKQASPAIIEAEPGLQIANNSSFTPRQMKNCEP